MQPAGRIKGNIHGTYSLLGSHPSSPFQVFPKGTALQGMHCPREGICKSLHAVACADSSCAHQATDADPGRRRQGWRARIHPGLQDPARTLKFWHALRAHLELQDLDETLQ